MEMKISFSGGKKVDADYKGFTIKTDQPKHEGGTGSTPEPFSLFIASIGTCIGSYVLSFCQKRNIPTDNINLAIDMSAANLGRYNLIVKVKDLNNKTEISKSINFQVSADTVNYLFWKNIQL